MQVPLPATGEQGCSGEHAHGGRPPSRPPRWEPLGGGGVLDGGEASATADLGGPGDWDRLEQAVRDDQGDDDGNGGDVGRRIAISGTVAAAPSRDRSHAWPVDVGQAACRPGHQAAWAGRSR